MEDLQLDAGHDAALSLGTVLSAMLCVGGALGALFLVVFFLG